MSFSLSPSIKSSFFSSFPLSFLYLFHFTSFQAVPHFHHCSCSPALHLSLSFSYPQLPLSLNLKSISPSSAVSPFFSSLFRCFIVFLRHSRVSFCPCLTPSIGLFTSTHTLNCSLSPPSLPSLQEMHLCVFVCRCVWRCCLSRSCAVRTNSSRSTERWNNKANDCLLAPPCIPLSVSLSPSLCLSCFFSSSHQITLSWPATPTGFFCHASLDRRDFQDTFQDMANACNCPALCPTGKL